MVGNSTTVDAIREAFTVDETAFALHVGRVTVYKLLNEGRLRRVKIGTRTVIPRSEIDRLLNGSDDTRAA